MCVRGRVRVCECAFAFQSFSAIISQLKKILLSYSVLLDQTPDQTFVLASLDRPPPLSNPGMAPGLFLAPTMWMESMALSVLHLISHFSFFYISLKLEFFKP